MATRTLSNADVINLFGNPWEFVHPDGSTAKWEEEILAVVDLPRPLPLSFDPGRMVTKIRCHRRIVPNLRAVFDEILKPSGVALAVKDFAGCFNFRAQRKATVLSRHAWGIAIDINSVDNPMGKTPVMDPRIVASFESHGFVWGGNFGRGTGKRVDGMHFEFADPTKLVA